MLMGCAHSDNTLSQDTIISSVAMPDSSGKKRYLLVAGQTLDADSATKLAGCAAYLHRVLEQHGFVRADRDKRADVLIVYSFRIGEPMVSNYGFATPQKRWTGVGSPHAMLSLATAESGLGASCLDYGGGRLQRPANGTKSLHDCLLSLRAYDYTAYRQEKKLRPVWATTARCLGSPDQPQAVFLALMQSAEPYLAKNAPGSDGDLLSKSEN
jgi:hypothetical protein